MAISLAIIGILIAIIGVLITIRLSKKRVQRPKLSITERHEELKKIKHTSDIVEIFLPNGELVFGAAWAEKEWSELLKDCVNKLGDNNVSVATFGNKYYLVDLISGEVISIPLDPQRGLTLKQSGVRVGQVLLLRKTK